MIYDEKYFKIHYKKQSNINLFKKLSYLSYVKYLYKLRDGRLLDCGCGIGNFLIFSERKFVVMGFDISEYAVSRAVTRTKNANLWVASVLNKIDLEDQSVDVVTAFDIVEHIIGHDFFFNEVHRILCHEGVFLLRTPNLKSWALKRKGVNWYGYRDKTHISLKETAYWIRELRKTGFYVTDIGTDLVWDIPIFTNIPRLLEKMLFQGSKFLWQLYMPFAHVCWGDNLIIVCKKGN